MTLIVIIRDQIKLKLKIEINQKVFLENAAELTDKINQLGIPTIQRSREEPQTHQEPTHNSKN